MWVQMLERQIVQRYQLRVADKIPPRGHFRRGDRFLGKAHTLARAISRCSACNHLEISAGDGHGWLWSVVAEAVVRACLTSIGNRKKCTSTAGRVSGPATAFNFC